MRSPLITYVNKLWSSAFQFANLIVNIFVQHSQTPLHLAAEHDHSEVVQLFLKHKPDLVSMPNKNGFTCAHIAAAKGSVAVIKELMRLNKESVINARISVCSMRTSKKMTKEIT